MFRFASLVAFVASEDYEAAFQQFANRFEKVYSENERAERLAIFTANLQFIEVENAKGTNSYSLGVTPLADRTFDEFKASMKTFKRPRDKISRTTYELKNSILPDDVDWVRDGAVEPVQNQGQCGSCWAFSAVGALEAARAREGEGLMKLSEQHILDCDGADFRCHGGWMDNAFEFVKQNGLCTEESYSYKCLHAGSDECKKSACHTNCTYGIRPGEVTGLIDIPSNDEHAFREALAQQPMAVAIEADTRVFQFYTGGILTSEACGTSLDHGVLVVGYGVDNGTTYFKVKNSWGSNWGEHGFIRLGQGDKRHGGICGILKSASFPLYRPLSKQVQKTVIA
eukprot:GEMP01035782.1.p1 GENE.GEMP01035782.1~~GEMP01035782.1.p1  ORF type:complete len:340 (+),score=69.05 GEMP01035782.1:66-1085(+)